MIFQKCIRLGTPLYKAPWWFPKLNTHIKEYTTSKLFRSIEKFVLEKYDAAFICAVSKRIEWNVWLYVLIHMITRMTHYDKLSQNFLDYHSMSLADFSVEWHCVLCQKREQHKGRSIDCYHVSSSLVKALVLRWLCRCYHLTSVQ